MFNALKIDCPSNPSADSTWYRDQVEEDIHEQTRHAPENKFSWIHWAVAKALGDACDPRENEPLDMFAENDLVTSITMEFAFGSCKLTKF